MSRNIVTYGTTAADYWEGQGDIEIRDVKGNHIATIPLRFMIVAFANTWTYIYTAISDCVENDGFLRDPQGNRISEDTEVIVGSYTYVRTDDAALGCTYTRGPESPRMGRAPGFNDTEEASSRASSTTRSSTGQNNFRFDVAVRDTGCLLTGAPAARCVAAHIVPLSRQDLYARILGRKPVVNPFQARMGLFLRQDLHFAFVKYDWALLPLEAEYVVHYFKPADQSERDLHGKRIPYNRFGFTIYPEAVPNRRMLLWHYKQCVQMHFRGFSRRISAEDTLADVQNAMAAHAAPSLPVGPESDLDQQETGTTTTDS